MSLGNLDSWLGSFRSNSLLERDKLNNSLGKSQRAKTVAIAAGKGGVGKTTIALKLSLELAKLNFKVLLIDCDYNLSNTSIKLGLPVNNHFYHLISSQRTFDECLYKFENFHLLPGCNGNVKLFDQRLDIDQIIIDIIQDQEKNYDFIILDSPAGLSDKVLTLNAYCEQRLMILNPDKSSLTDTYSLIKLLRMKYGVRENFLVVNRFFSQSQYQRIIDTMMETTLSFLKVHCVPLGGIKENENRFDNFDKRILQNEQSAFHRDFCKVLKKYTDKFETPVAPFKFEEKFEHKVQLNIVPRSGNVFHCAETEKS